MTDHLLIVDASGFAFRSYYAFPPYYRESDGQPTGAVLGFMSMLWRMIGAAEADKPTHAVAVFDTPGKNFRHDLFPEYKANRAPARSVELKDQMPFMRHVAEALGMAVTEKQGFEADDVIATIACRAMAAGVRSTIVSSDKDFGQLVVDGWIEIVDPMAKRRVLEADVEEKFGVPPHQVADVQALWGDAVDNIPGIAGCGKDIAARLIRRFGSLEELLDRVDECRFMRVKAELKRKRKYEGIDGARTGAEWTKLFLKLTTLRTDVDVDLTFDQMKAQAPVKSHVMRMLRVLEAGPRFHSIFQIEEQQTRVVPRVENEFAWWEDELAAPGQKIPDHPQSGYYRSRLVRGGPYVNARIWRKPLPDGTDAVFCEVGGKPADPFSRWPSLAPRPIAKKEFNYMTADSEHARKHRPTSPQANPKEPINRLSQPVSTNPRIKS
jgi:DNA polymerase-1